MSLRAPMKSGRSNPILTLIFPLYILIKVSCRTPPPTKNTGGVPTPASASPLYAHLCSIYASNSCTTTVAMHSHHYSYTTSSCIPSTNFLILYRQKLVLDWPRPTVSNKSFTHTCLTPLAMSAQKIAATQFFGQTCGFFMRIYHMRKKPHPAYTELSTGRWE